MSSMTVDALKEAIVGLPEQLHRSLRLNRPASFGPCEFPMPYRALAIRNGDEFTWFWIGSHDKI
jgi:hypothetical protein